MIAQLLARFSKPLPTKPVMAKEDIDVIRAFALGDNSLREQAIAAHHRNIFAVGARGNLYMSFMAEIDTPMPDLYERDRFRNKIVNLARAA